MSKEGATSKGRACTTTRTARSWEQLGAVIDDTVDNYNFGVARCPVQISADGQRVVILSRTSANDAEKNTHVRRKRLPMFGIRTWVQQHGN